MDNTVLLEPNHHFLLKFQNVLKDHLLRQINKVQLEISNLDNDYKKSFDEYKGTARTIQNYETQIDKQNKKMISNENELKALFECNHIKETDIFNKKKDLAEMQNKIQEVSQKDKAVGKELDRLKHFEEYLTQLENDQTDSIKLKNIVTEKCQSEQYQFNELKQQRDLVVYKLMEEIFGYEDEIATIDLQIKIKNSEREEIERNVQDKTLYLDSLSGEHKRTIQSWNAIINQIGQKDQLYFEMANELEKIKGELKNVENEIVNIKKQERQEMEQNERMTLMLNQLVSDSKRLSHRTNMQNNNLQKAQDKLYQIFSIIEQTGKNLDQIAIDIKKQREKNESLEKKLEKISREKFELDGKLLGKLQFKLINNKIIKGLLKNLEMVQDQNKNFEIELNKIENSNGSLLYEIETKKKIVTDLESQFNEIRKQEHDLESEFKKIDDRIKQFKQIIELKHKTLTFLNIKLNERLQKTQGIEMSETEQKIQSLIKNINEINFKIKDLKQHWIMQQNSVVILSEKREKQLNIINILKKQKLIVEQKNLRINDEIETYTVMEQEIQRQITNYQKKILQINQKISQFEVQKQELIRESSLNESDYGNQITEMEIKYSKLESDIEDIESNVNNLTSKFVQMNRELFAWEAKIKDLAETKNEISKEQSTNSEMGSMRSEIQRMNVRYSQLKKVAEKLSYDLEFSLKKREAIINASDLMEKKSGHKIYSEIYFNKKRDQLQSDIKKFQNKIDEVTNFLKQVEEKIEEKIDEINFENSELTNLNLELKHTEDNLRNLKTEKQKNLDFIILKQNLIKFYDELLKGKYRYLYKTESLLNQEFDKQKEIHENLLTLSDQLNEQFNQFQFEIKQISNVLCLKL